MGNTATGSVTMLDRGPRAERTRWSDLGDTIVDNSIAKAVYGQVEAESNLLGSTRQGEDVSKRAIEEFWRSARRVSNASDANVKKALRDQVVTHTLKSFASREEYAKTLRGIVVQKYAAEYRTKFAEAKTAGVVRFDLGEPRGQHDTQDTFLMALLRGLDDPADIFVSSQIPDPEQASLESVICQLESYARSLRRPEGRKAAVDGKPANNPEAKQHESLFALTGQEQQQQQQSRG